MLSYLLLVLLFTIVNGDLSNDQVTVYFYPGFKANISVPPNCDLIKNASNSFIACNCNCYFDNKCNYGFNKGDILRYLTFSQPQFADDNIDEWATYRFWINKGINDFKINTAYCTSVTCYNTIISNLFDENDDTFTIKVTCMDYH